MLRTYSAQLWKKTLFTWIFGRAWYPLDIRVLPPPPPPPRESGQFTLISMGLIRYSCSHSGPHEPIHVKFGVWGFLIMFYWNMVMKMLKCKNENLMTSHFGTLLGSITLLRQFPLTSVTLSQLFPKKVEIFITLEVLVWVMTACWVLHSRLIYFWRNMNISSIFYFSKSTSINTQYSSLWDTLEMMLFTKYLIKWNALAELELAFSISQSRLQ